jgi:hypothetical protein
LAGVVGKRSAVNTEKLDRVLDKIRSGKIKEREREKRSLTAEVQAEAWILFCFSCTH